jgi:hypothetical protein
MAAFRKLAEGGGGGSGPVAKEWILISSETSNTERIKSILGGLDLFLRYPIFGAGLGAYISDQIEPVVVIHSTPIWLLAETGIVGTAIFASVFFRLLFQEGRNIGASPLSSAISMMLVAFALMALVHEIMYQRAFWLFIGMCLGAGRPILAQAHPLAHAGQPPEPQDFRA